MKQSTHRAFKHSFVAILGFILLAGCAGGTRETGVKTIRPGNEPISNDGISHNSDTAYIDALMSAFESRRTAMCETSTGNIIFNSSASLTAKLSSADLNQVERSRACEITIAPTEAVIQISLPRALLTHGLTLSVTDSAGKIVRELEIKSNSVTLEARDIPPEGSITLTSAHHSMIAIIKR